MALVKLKINGEEKQLNIDSQTPLLWALRDYLQMTGTKFGCGIAQCGACTVMMDGVAVRSCVIPVGAVTRAEITTIEGLSPDNSHPLQKAWLDLNVAQCGYCQSGMLMTAAALLKQNRNPTDEDINNAMDNICRCGTYLRVRAAIHQAAKSGA